MKSNPFVISPAPKGAAGTAAGLAPGPASAPAAGPGPELLQIAFGKELLEFGPAVFLADLRGEIRWSNAAYRRIAETKTAGGTIGKLLPLKDIAEEIDLKRQSIFREDPSPSGAVLRSRHVPLYDERGQLAGFGGLLNLSNETAERGEETPLALERHMDFIRLSSDWMWETDTGFNLQMVTHRVANVLGYSPHELIGRNLLSMVSSEPLRQALRRRLERLSPFRDQPFDADDNAGRRKLFVMSAAPVFDKADGSLRGFRGAATDITELTRREESLRSAKEAAEVASRAKSHFLANMSHELRTPLNAIIGFSEMIATRALGEISPRYFEYAGDIRSSGRYLLSIIEDLLDMSRIELGQVQLKEEPVSLADLVGDVVKFVILRAREKNVAIREDELRTLPKVTIDPKAMRQCLINLLTNAIKFSPVGGTIEIGGTLEPGGGIALAVIDHGLGIRREDLANVFQPFWQNEAYRRQNKDGIGLGLAITRRLVEAHDGTIEIESREGEGTTVTIHLPARRLIRPRPQLTVVSGQGDSAA